MTEEFEQCIINQIKVKDELIDKLHKELEFYKQEQSEKIINHVMKEIISLRNSMKKRLVNDIPEMSREELIREYKYLFEDVSDILERQNIDPFESEEGDSFDGKKHHVSRFEDTDNEELNHRIKQSISEGYIKNEKILMPEKVIVYKFNE